ncbi:uncharacterized protein LOC123319241 [Coccinella septempunctata]|uniref:uncharacterized protein LOC123319241 n=1 Tax=Coccinella septempunctata TaxID=41139 RepID=UPI001D096344|nr:uncharacterized protein LOC123319241 [Coccinella septempunctata]
MLNKDTYRVLFEVLIWNFNCSVNYYPPQKISLGPPLPYHIFGNHSNCRDSYCKRKNSGEEDYTKNMTPDFFMEILTNVEPMVHKADRLIYNETTNQAGRYMALVAKCTGGKRVNFSGSVSYTVRAYGAALSHAAGPAWHLHTWRGSLGVNTEKTFLRRRKIHERRREKLLSTSRKRKTLSNGPDSNYGPDAAQPDITEEEMSSKKSEFLNILRNRISDSSKLKDLEEKTRGQHDNALWRQYRQDYLTSSNFGSVVKRKSTTPCHNFVKVLLYKKQLNTAGVLYGRMNESKAVSLYEHSKNIKVTRCGLFIDPEYPFLGASPDGLVGDDGLIEVKCLQSIKGKLRDYKKPHCFTIEDDRIRLKKNHNYFYQVQGQLNICKKKFCDFVLYTDEDFHIERIECDEALWRNIMLPKLEQFYMNCILPEIIDGRIPRGMRARDMNETRQ